MTATFWDQRYADPGYKYGVLPNAFLVSQAPQLPPSAQVLVPGDGEGRNSVWLAAQGHQVLAVDYAQQGLAKARALARQHGPAVDSRLQTQWADLADWQPEPASVDAVVMTYVHLPAALRTAAHQRLARALRPGGLWILEAFHPRQLAYTSGGPRDEDMLLTLARLRGDLASLLHEQLAWEGEIALDEGPGHQGPAWVTRWVAQAP